MIWLDYLNDYFSGDKYKWGIDAEFHLVQVIKTVKPGIQT